MVSYEWGIYAIIRDQNWLTSAGFPVAGGDRCEGRTARFKFQPETFLYYSDFKNEGFSVKSNSFMNLTNCEI